MEYGMVLVFLFVAVVFVAGGIITNRVLMPYKPNPEKNSTYECGLDPVGDARILYGVKFYVFALLYVIFAVEGAFMLPWAAVYKQIAGFAPFVEGVIFIAILVLGLAYAWKKEELKWD